MKEEGLHRLDMDTFLALSQEEARLLLPDWLGTFVAGGEARQVAAAEAVRRVLEGADEAVLERTLACFASAGQTYAHFPADPLAKAIIRAFLGSFCGGSTLEGAHHLRDASVQGPTLIVCNHLAYCDTVLKDLVLSQAGADDLGARLTAVAGPKVYETPFRRMASLAIGTLKTAQSTAIAHSDAQLSPRQVAEIAVGTMRTAQDLMRAGELVVLYGEGSRSRDQRLGSFIKAIRKYANVEGCRLVPVAIAGSDEVMPIGQLLMHPGQVQVRIGSPVPVADWGAAGAVEQCWAAIAALLPDRHRPSPATLPWS